MDAYLITGDEFLATEESDRIRREAGADPLSEVVFDGAATDAAALGGALQTPSLLGGRRVVIVRNAHEIGKPAAEEIKASLGRDLDVVLVLVASRRTPVDADVARAGTVVRVEPPKGRRLATWVTGRARSGGLKLDDRGAWALIEAIGTDLRDLESALDQLSTRLGPGARVGAADVKRIWPGVAEQRMYVLTDGVGDRRLGVAMASLRRLLAQGDEPLVIFGALVAHVRRLLHAHRLGSAAQVGETLGMPPWRAERLLKQAHSYREDELVDALLLLADTDVQLKTGGGGPTAGAALERAVLSIVESGGS